MKGASLKYIQKYVRMKRVAEFNKKKLFPNLKEITESMGIVEAASTIEDRNDKDVTLIVVGDGKRPRTATLATNMTRWNAISIDPNMNKDIESDSERIVLKKQKVEEESMEFAGPVILCFPHSHARISSALAVIKAPKRHVISLPCCVKDDISKEPDKTFSDDAILSEKNTINIYFDCYEWGSQ